MDQFSTEINRVEIWHFSPTAPFCGLNVPQVALHLLLTLGHSLHNDPMISAKTLRQENNQQWVQLATAFYSLAHNDERRWRELPALLRETDVGVICEEFLKSRDEQLINKAGELLAGNQWFTALGRSL